MKASGRTRVDPIAFNHWLAEHGHQFPASPGRPVRGSMTLIGAICRRFGVATRTAHNLLAAARERQRSLDAAAMRVEPETVDGLRQLEGRYLEPLARAYASRYAGRLSQPAMDQISLDQANTRAVARRPQAITRSASEVIIDLVRAIRDKEALSRIAAILSEKGVAVGSVVRSELDPRAELLTAIELYEMTGRPSARGGRLLAELRSEIASKSNNDVLAKRIPDSGG